VILGESSPDGAVLTVNTNESGLIGILIDSAEPIVVSAVPRRIVMVTFDVMPGASGDVPILMTNTLAASGTSDAEGNTLPTRYVDGIVRVGSKE